MSRTVYLHVGAPRTGTPYLHRRLAANKESLAEHGVHHPVPDDRPSGQQHAALDLVGRTLPGEDVSGQWDALVRSASRCDGTVIVSHDQLASARPEAIRRAMDSFAGDDVHVVYAARDLARQIPAEWQESLKHGRGWSFARYLQRVVDQPRSNSPWWFWRSQGLPDVLARWSAGLAPENVHVVTVPQGLHQHEEAWLRYSRAFGIDPAWAPHDTDGVVPLLSVAEAAVIRGLNRRLRASPLDHADQRHLVRDRLAGAGMETNGRTEITLRPDLYPWVEEVTEEWLAWLVGSGVEVVGDLDDLRPVRPTHDSWVDPDQVEPGDLGTVAMHALTLMTVEAARRGDPGGSSRLTRAARRIRGL